MTKMKYISSDCVLKLYMEQIKLLKQTQKAGLSSS